MRPIDADALIETIRNFVDTMSVCTSTEYCTGLRFMKKQAIEAVENAPTVDAVPVVRCKECVHRDPEDHRCDCGGHEWLKGRVLPMPDDFFCADGERKEGAE